MTDPAPAPETGPHPLFVAAVAALAPVRQPLMARLTGQQPVTTAGSDPHAATNSLARAAAPSSPPPSSPSGPPAPELASGLDRVRGDLAERDRVDRTRMSVDENALLTAMAISLRADCTRRLVAAVLIDVHGRIRGTGRNGAPPGEPGCLSAGACPRGQSTYDQVAGLTTYTPDTGAAANAVCTALHAEENCLLFSSDEARRGATLYVTDEPCPNCRRLIRGSGIARVVWLVLDENGPRIREWRLGA